MDIGLQNVLAYPPEAPVMSTSLPVMLLSAVVIVAKFDLSKLCRTYSGSLGLVIYSLPSALVPVPEIFRLHGPPKAGGIGRHASATWGGYSPH